MRRAKRTLRRFSGIGARRPVIAVNAVATYRGIDGLFRLDLYRRAGEVETEFMTVMWFTNHEAIVRFAGPDWETAVVPASARAMLSRFEEKAAHYESRVAQEAAPHI